MAGRSDPESWDAAQAYVSAVGTVAHDWNRLHEDLGEIFVILLHARTKKIAFGIRLSTTGNSAIS